MGKQPEDNKNTTYWAIGSVGEISFVGTVVHFMLCNRMTGRAHTLLFTGGGFTFGKEVSVAGAEVDYTTFRTRRPCNFNDFDSAGAKLSGIKASAGIGWSRVYLTIWPGGWIEKPLAKITMGGWSVGKLGLSGKAEVYGVLGVHYGDGERRGLVALVLEPPELPDGPRKLPSRVQSKPGRQPLMMVPTDTLFGFDSAALTPAATPALEKAAEFIETRDRGQPVIVGHTDSVGDAQYNKRLSLRRAKAVQVWLAQHGVERAESFPLRGEGEEKPLAPNRRPDGSDNPEGRTKNRRVEIHFTD